MGHLCPPLSVLSEWDRLTLDQSPDPSAPPPQHHCRILLHHDSPAQKGRPGSGVSQWQLVLPHFSFNPPPPRDGVTFTEGRFISSGVPALFGGGTLKGVERRRAGGDCCEGGWLKKGEKLTNEARIATKQWRKGKDYKGRTEY